MQTDFAAPPILSPDALQAENERKLKFVLSLLEERRLGAVLLQRNENVAWMTCGIVDRRVLIPSVTGVVSLLILRDGRCFYLTTNNEALRLAEEDFSQLPYEPVVFPWFDGELMPQVRRLTGSAALGADMPHPDALLLDLKPLRATLLDTEITRYRWLCSHTARAVAEVTMNLEPGVGEREMEARASYALLRQGITPSVLLMAVDDRVRKYRHAVASNARLEKFGMVNLCARKWGLAVSMTRFVSFGSMATELQERFEGAAFVNAQLLHATRAGATADALFSVAEDAYRQAGFPGEERNHHQGGLIGYGEREWLARPGGKETVADSQAFAWNPTIHGGKVEDTALLLNGSIEILTETPELPVVSTRIGSADYPAAGVLVR